MISLHQNNRLKRRKREVLGLDDFTAEDIELIKASKAPESAKAFDCEVKDGA